MNVPELEIALHRWDAECYRVDLRFQQPDDQAGPQHSFGELEPLCLDFEALRRAINPIAYGSELTRRLFIDAKVEPAFTICRAVAHSQNLPLRVRLLIGPSAPELHSLRWETLLDPATNTLLLYDENIIFSRYLSSLNWQPIRLRPQRKLTALVVVASPKNVADWGLAAVDVERELATARTGLGDIAYTELAEPGTVTLRTIADALRTEADILYLVAHGALKQGEPVLYLEDEENPGQTKAVKGRDFVAYLSKLTVRPRLVVLASCQSAGNGLNSGVADSGVADSGVADDGVSDGLTTDTGALAALGPRLTEAGIPAVVAMQGNISMETVQQFMPIFFAELRRDGQIDRAMAAARNHVNTRRDWWMPTLFMRLRSGRIWYVPGFGQRQDTPKKWDALLGSIRDEECTPILGPGLTEFLYGSTQSLAGRLAEEHQYPLSPHEREELSQVAQYLSIKESPRFSTTSVLRQLTGGILNQHGAGLSPDLASFQWRDASIKKLARHLPKLIQAVSIARQETIEAEPYHTLARLPFPLYITTDTSNLMCNALELAGKKPAVEYCRWKKEMEGWPSVYDKNPDYRPSVKSPLVFHLFGHIQEWRSLVLTEDDYFDYLIGATSNKDLIPAVVRRALADTALLFLGFHMEERNFRVLFRSILGQEGSASLGEYDAHIAAQVTPEEGRLLEPKEAQSYLEAYFQKNGEISIYWGDPDTFMSDLHREWDWEESP